MKKTWSRIAAGLAILGLAGPASAMVFTLDSYLVTLNDTDPGLVVYPNDKLITPISINLDVGQSITAALFEIGTTETWAGNPDDKVEKDITVAFDFSAPEVMAGVTGTGATVGHSLLLWDWATVEWDGATEFNFGDGGLFTIELSDETFRAPGSAMVMATMTYVRESAASVPEPTTLGLMGLGLAAIGFARKGRRA